MNNILDLHSNKNHVNEGDILNVNCMQTHCKDFILHNYEIRNAEINMKVHMPIFFKKNN